MAREYKKGVKAEKKKGLSIREKRKKTSELVFKGVNDGTQSRGKALSHNQKLRKKIREVKMAQMLADKLEREAKKKKKQQPVPEPEPTSDGELDSDSEVSDAESTHIEMEEDSKPARVQPNQSNGHHDMEEQSDNFSSEEDDEEENEEEDDDEEAAAGENKTVYTFESSDDEDLDADDHDILDESKDSDDSEEEEEADSDSSGWSDAERECDEEEGEEVREEEEEDTKEDYNDGLPPLADVLKEIKTVPSLENSIMRIERVLEILKDFRNQAAPNRKRTEYMQILCADLCLRYSYNSFLMEQFFELFSIKDLIKFLEANESDRPLTIRTNTIKCARKELTRALTGRGVTGEAVRWSKVGMTIYTANTAVGGTPEYMAGHYMLQGASSLLPVMALAPKMNELVMDMCAAPGGKATHIASMMKNTGALFANDANKKRIKSLVANIHRLGVHNAVVSCMDGRKLAKKLRGSLDRVLLDAPCTGTGIISKDERVKSSKSARDIQTCSHLQYDLLLAAIDSVNAHSETGGYVVYSTCSVLVEENERVINKALEKRDVKLVPTGLEIGASGLCNFKQHRFHPSMKLLKRIYPHEKNMEGFCVAKLKVLSNYKPKKSLQEEAKKTKKVVPESVVESSDVDNKQTNKTVDESAEVNNKKTKKAKKVVPESVTESAQVNNTQTKKTKKIVAESAIESSEKNKQTKKTKKVVPESVADSAEVKNKKTKKTKKVPESAELNNKQTKKTKKIVPESVTESAQVNNKQTKKTKKIVPESAQVNNEQTKKKRKIVAESATESSEENKKQTKKTKKVPESSVVNNKQKNGPSKSAEQTVPKSPTNGQVNGQSKNKKRKREQSKPGNNKTVWPLPRRSLQDVRRGGYYSTSPLPGLRIISVNTNYCNTLNWWLLLDHKDPVDQLSWLAGELSSSREAGQMVHIVTHIPPGNPDCEAIWSRNFAVLMTKYRDIVKGVFTGHQHVDQWQVIHAPGQSKQGTQVPVAMTYVAPAAATFREHSPAFKVFSVDAQDFRMLDYTVYTANLTFANQPGAKPVYEATYSAKQAYQLPDLSPRSWQRLTYQMAANKTLFDTYIRYAHNYWVEPSEVQSCDSRCRRQVLCFLLVGDSSNRKPCAKLPKRFN